MLQELKRILFWLDIHWDLFVRWLLREGCPPPDIPWWYRRGWWICAHLQAWPRHRCHMSKYWWYSYDLDFTIWIFLFTNISYLIYYFICSSTWIILKLRLLGGLEWIYIGILLLCDQTQAPVRSHTRRWRLAATEVPYQLWFLHLSRFQRRTTDSERRAFCSMNLNCVPWLNCLIFILIVKSKLICGYLII